MQEVNKANLTNLLKKPNKFCLSQTVNLSFYQKFFQKSANILSRIQFVTSQLAGVLVAGCGKETVRLRPAAILENKHVNIFLGALDDVLKEISPSVGAREAKAN